MEHGNWACENQDDLATGHARIRNGEVTSVTHGYVLRISYGTKTGHESMENARMEKVTDGWNHQAISSSGISTIRLGHGQSHG